jgi:DNA-binding CsgD family transcriptional regulator
MWRNQHAGSARGQRTTALTAREREIVRLLGSGLTSREVSERLCLSLRTVEGHVYRAMTKTGSASRDELIRLLFPQRRRETGS